MSVQVGESFSARSDIRMFAILANCTGSNAAVAEYRSTTTLWSSIPPKTINVNRIISYTRDETPTAHLDCLYFRENTVQNIGNKYIIYVLGPRCRRSCAYLYIRVHPFFRYFIDSHRRN